MRVPLRGAIWVTSLLLVLVAADTTLLRAASSQDKPLPNAPSAESTKESLEKAAAAPNPEAESHYNLALAADHQGDVDKAITEYRKTLVADPNFAAAHYHLGRILKDAGQEQAAADEFAAACALEPANPQVCRK